MKVIQKKAQIEGSEYGVALKTKADENNEMHETFEKL